MMYALQTVIYNLFKKKKRYGFPIRVNIIFPLVSPRRWGNIMFFKLANTFLLLRAHFYKSKKTRDRKNALVSIKSV